MATDSHSASLHVVSAVQARSLMVLGAVDSHSWLVQCVKKVHARSDVLVAAADSNCSDEHVMYAVH